MVLYVGVIASASAVVQDDELGPSVKLVVDASQVLSTEHVRSRLIIDNPTSSNLLYYTTSVEFLVRDANGHIDKRHWITAITHLPVPFTIAAGKTQQFGIPLPECDVNMDPCSMHVSVQLSLYSKERQKGYDLTTNAVSYTFVPDPTATFRIEGLRGNRPLVIGQGDARGFVPQDVGFLQLGFATDPPSGLDEFVQSSLTQRGFQVTSSGRSDQTAEYTLVGGTGEASDIMKGLGPTPLASAVGEIRKRYGQQITRLSFSYIPDDFRFESLFN
jgi:hypothetical protein